MTDHAETRRDAERIREFLRQAEYFDSEEGADIYVDAIAALDRIMAELEELAQR